MADFVQPLNFEEIISYAVGDAMLFVYIALISFSVLAAKVRMPISAYLMMMFIFSGIMYFTIGFPLFFVVAVLLAIVITLAIMRKLKQ